MRVLTAWLDGARDLTDGDHLLYVAPPAPLLGQPVATYCGRRLTPEGTREFWGVLSEGVEDLPRNTKLYDAPSQLARPTDDELWDETLSERDRYHEVADDLAGHIAAITGVDIGEHSSANCPWQNAIEAAEEYKPAQAVDLGQLPRVIELLSNVSHTLVDWAADEQREAIGIVKALIDGKAVGK